MAPWVRFAGAILVEALGDRLHDLAQVGLNFGHTYQLVKNCGDENPLLELLQEPERLPAGTLRRLLREAARPSVLFLSDLLKELQGHNMALFDLATGYSHRCFVEAECQAHAALGQRLAELEGKYLAATARLMLRGNELTGLVPWPHGLRSPSAVVARFGFDAAHLDFAQNVHSALESSGFEEPLGAASALHDLALRRATALCRLQAELLAFASLDLLGSQLQERLRSPATFPRFEFHPACCRRYHVLAELLETQLGARASLVPARPLRLLEVGVNNAITSEYLLKKFKNLEFDGVDPFINAEEILAEASQRIRPHAPRARLWRLTSESAAEKFDPSTFDLIFIDGDHSYSAVKKDLQLWRSKLRPGGLLAGHDLFNLAFEGVIEALVEDLVTRNSKETIHFSTDFVWWIQV